METVIHTEDNARVCVSEWDDAGVWMGVQVRGASTGITLTRAEAEQLLAGLQALLAKVAA